VVGDASLRAMNERQGAFEAGGDENRSQRLARLGGVNRYRLAAEVLLAIFPGLRPFADLLHLFGRSGIFEVAFLLFQHPSVFGLAKEVEMVEHILRILRHCTYSCRSPTCLAAASDAFTQAMAPWSGARPGC